MARRQWHSTLLMLPYVVITLSQYYFEGDNLTPLSIGMMLASTGYFISILKNKLYHDCCNYQYEQKIKDKARFLKILQPEFFQETRVIDNGELESSGFSLVMSPIKNCSRNELLAFYERALKIYAIKTKPHRHLFCIAAASYLGHDKNLKLKGHFSNGIKRCSGIDSIRN